VSLGGAHETLMANKQFADNIKNFK